MFEKVNIAFVGNLQDFDKKLAYYTGNKKHEAEIRDIIETVIQDHRIMIILADKAILFSIADRNQYGDSYVWRWDDD